MSCFGLGQGVGMPLALLFGIQERKRERNIRKLVYVETSMLSAHICLFCCLWLWCLKCENSLAARRSIQEEHLEFQSQLNSEKTSKTYQSQSSWFAKKRPRDSVTASSKLSKRWHLIKTRHFPRLPLHAMPFNDVS